MKEITGASMILTEACNLSCSYCYEKKRSPAVMTEETVKKAVDFVFEHANDAPKLSFIWFGGEPMLNFAVLRYGYACASRRALAEKKELDNLIITNGTVWNAEIEEFLTMNPKIRLQLSWDGLPEFQEAERGQSQVLEQTLARMKLLPNDLHVHLQITPAMVPRLLENIDYIVGKMGDKANVVLRPIAELEGWQDEALLEKFREQLYLAFQKHEDKLEKIASCEKQLASNGTCGAGKNFATVTPAGELYACHRFYFNKNRDFKVGSLDGGFISSAKTDLLEEYTRDNVVGCTECDAFELCDRCIAANFGENYDVLMPTDANCAVYTSLFFAVFNYMKIHRPWTINYKPKDIVKIAAPPPGATAMDFVFQYVLPLVYELQERAAWLEDQNRRLSAKVEYDEKTQRSKKRTAVYHQSL
ncbi:MAG: SPASM domain-containing protein [Negativicutes bacterium]|nr:SPASM domain-containing protein [Negativicutes bacterium]